RDTVRGRLPVDMALLADPKFSLWYVRSFLIPLGSKANFSTTSDSSLPLYFLVYRRLFDSTSQKLSSVVDWIHGKDQVLKGWYGIEGASPNLYRWTTDDASVILPKF